MTDTSKTQQPACPSDLGDKTACLSKNEENERQAQQPTQGAEVERVAFERLVTEMGYSVARRENGIYDSSHTNLMRTSWNAALAYESEASRTAALSHPLTPADREEAVRLVAQSVFMAMRWALKNPCKGEPPEWQDGNSFAEERARLEAESIVAIIGAALEAKGYVGRKG